MTSMEIIERQFKGRLVDTVRLVAGDRLQPSLAPNDKKLL